MNNLQRSKRNVLIFSIFVLLCGWIGVLVDMLTNQAHYQNVGTLAGQGTPGMAIFIASPLLMVIILRTFAGDGWKDAGLKSKFWQHKKWYLLAWLIYPVVTSIVLLAGYVSGAITFSSSITLAAYFGLFIGQLGIQIVKNFFEESVWRGYLASKLLKFSWSDWKVYLVLGLVWNFWHLPYYLIFLSSSEIEATIPLGRLGFVAVATICVLCWTIMYVEIYRATNSIWPLVFMHAMEDAVINPLLIFKIVHVVPQWSFMFSLSAGILPTILYLSIGLFLRHLRIKKEKQAA